MLDIRTLRTSFIAGIPNEPIASNGVSLTLEPGVFCMVTGSNGDGKSAPYEPYDPVVVPEELHRDSPP